MGYGIFQICCPISWSDPDPLEKLLHDLVKHEFNQNNSHTPNITFVSYNQFLENLANYDFICQMFICKTT